MFLKKIQPKASTLCASSALLVLGGFMSVNLAGCGGGGGGGNGGGFGTPTATPAAQGLTFNLVRQNQEASNGGTVTLTSSSGTVFSATANGNGVASIANVPPGTYAVRFTVVDAAGAVISTTNTSITVTRASGQTFLLLQDQVAGATTSFNVTGVIRLNVAITPAPTETPTASLTPIPTTTATASPTATADPTAIAAQFQFSNCGTNSDLVTDTLLVEAIDLDTSKGQPIIAQVRRTASAANRGSYAISLPFAPRAFRIRVSQFDTSGARFAGFSAVTNFNGATVVNGITTIGNLNICVNTNGTAPVVAPVPLPATPGEFFPFSAGK